MHAQVMNFDLETLVSIFHQAFVMFLKYILRANFESEIQSAYINFTLNLDNHGRT